MLNRRLLRSKVVQALYAIAIAEESNRLLAYDEIAEAYKPDLNSMEPQNLRQLEGYRQLAGLSFDELVAKGALPAGEEVPRPWMLSGEVRAASDCGRNRLSEAFSCRVSSFRFAPRRPPLRTVR